MSGLAVFIYFHHFKDIISLSLVSLSEISYHLCRFSPVYKVFYLQLILRLQFSFDYDVTRCGFPCDYLLGVCWDSWIFKLIFFMIISLNTFSASISICFPETPITYILECLIFPLGHWGYFSIFSSLFFRFDDFQLAFLLLLPRCY